MVAVAVLTQMVWSAPAFEAVVPGVAVITTSSVVAVQGALLMVQRKVYAPAVVMPVMPLVAELGVVIVGVTGPLMKLHAPVPVVAVLPAMVAVPLVAQMFWSAPALAVVGMPLTTMFIWSLEEAQGAFVIVHWNT